MDNHATPRTGYTLPVFACAAAIAALRWLYRPEPLTRVSVELVQPPGLVEIPIEQMAGLPGGEALAVTRSDPGDNLDLTRLTPIWALVAWADPRQQERIAIRGGEGVGKQLTTGQDAIYAYAHQLLQVNLEHWLQAEDRIQVTIILPEGRSLAQRTSNAAFGIVEGLSLLGTSGLAQPLSAPAQLEEFRQELQQKAARHHSLVFCVGENGLALAAQQGIPSTRLIKTANWLGPMLVEAGLQGLSTILLLGYHGKLIKLAAGIFHTHHFLADGRQEILTAHAAQLGLPLEAIRTLFASPTAEAALAHLRHLDATTGSDWVQGVYGAIATQIDQRCQAYIRTHSDRSVQVGSALFDGDRQIFRLSATGAALLPQLLLP